MNYVLLLKMKYYTSIVLCPTLYNYYSKISSYGTDHYDIVKIIYKE